MKHRNLHPRKECGGDHVRTLLEESEDTAEFAEAARHVENCPACRRRLEELADGDLSKSEFREALAACRPKLSLNFDPVPLESDLVSPSNSASFDLDFLSPGSHPETLGRLGRYEVENVVGRGGMGLVLKAHDMELNRPVAIKVLALHLADSGSARQRFAREGRAAAAVMHENVVAIHNVEASGDMPYLVMQYVDGQSLQARVDEEGPLQPKEILRIGMQAAAGLAAAHAQGLVHRDVKPSNILLEGELERVLLTDFGLARAADDANLTRSGMVAGTPSFMSPEQARGEPIDARSDLFSLGASLYFAATGHPPFRAEGWMAVVHRLCHDRHRPVCEANPEIPLDLSQVIDRRLHKKPHRRFKSATMLREALAELLVRSQHPGRLGRARVWRGAPRRRRQTVFLAAGVGIAAVIGTSLFALHQSPPQGNSPATASVHTPRAGEKANSAESLSSRSRRLSSLNREWANAEAGLVQDLEQLESANLDRRFLTTEPGTSTWDQEVNSIGAALDDLQSRWQEQPNRQRPVSPR